ncbi:hypothetical protein CEUSTIGMA_g10087.t1 [Chlamydomonas eustigma]|uniref:EF-hand domain-containing protein n=1 Tax=Chlamydomonas eustigma TaxID=1157962 RepID=A0A250XHV8_9CHLO|nr:hypothetical protein CEUSTIGMA_g10087.t1 [Chlamydomonas eustigma]|eukprot:GAX82661.1 hypothetical protein CEUSTIGMA_g10087.t1 [Chlamydomonas eustigma]
MGPFKFIGNFAFGFFCDRCFEKVDVDNSGFLDVAEVELAVLYLYNMFNKRLPGWQDPPNRKTIQEALNLFDADKNGKLDKKEFKEFVRSFTKSGPDAFFQRVGRSMVFHSAGAPAVAWSVKRVAQGTPIGGMHLAVLSPLLFTTVKSIRGLLPF